MIFSLCFAVQPDGKSDEAGNKEKMLVHAIPFMILEMGLLLAQVRKLYLLVRFYLEILFYFLLRLPLYPLVRELLGKKLEQKDKQFLRGLSMLLSSM